MTQLAISKQTFFTGLSFHFPDLHDLNRQDPEGLNKYLTPVLATLT